MEDKKIIERVDEMTANEKIKHCRDFYNDDLIASLSQKRLDKLTALAIKQSNETVDEWFKEAFPILSETN